MKIISFIICILACWIISCSNTEQKKTTAPSTSDSITQKKDTLPKIKPLKLAVIDTLKDDMANIICALSPKKYFKKIEKENYWAHYKQIVTQDWNAVATNKIKPIKHWTDSMQLFTNKDTNTLFYPFAGADFLYSNSFFPNSKNYVLIGLEPVGKLKVLDTLKSLNLQGYLNKIESSLFFSNKLGFFRTKSMRAELNQADLDGTIHLLTFYIKRCGYSITGINYVDLDSTGNITINTKKNIVNPKAVKIDFCDSTRTKSQTMYFFSLNLSDQYLTKHDEILKFAKSLGQKNTFLKAASYLMHEKEFSIIRQFILDNSEIVLQDDSGIPYKNFVSENWDVKLFGTYSKTISIFRAKYQPELKEAINKSPYHGKIPFRIGYNLNHNEVNLIYSKKKNK